MLASLASTPATLSGQRPQRARRAAGCGSVSSSTRRSGAYLLQHLWTCRTRPVRGRAATPQTRIASRSCAWRDSWRASTRPRACPRGRRRPAKATRIEVCCAGAMLCLIDAAARMSTVSKAARARTTHSADATPERRTGLGGLRRGAASAGQVLEAITATSLLWIPRRRWRAAASFDY